MKALGMVAWTVLSVVGLLVGACSTTTNEGGSETNWVACDESTSCSTGFECRGGYCVPPLGSTCFPSDQTNPNFPGFSVTEVNIETGGTQCGGGVCMSAYFNGRVGCPYGQAAGEEACMTSGPNPVPVTVAVDPQYVDRSPERSVYCSCRCDGPGSGPFCSCPSGYGCEPFVPEDSGSPADGFAGSYCVKEGTHVTRWTDIGPGRCVAALGNCDGR